MLKSIVFDALTSVSSTGALFEDREGLEEKPYYQVINSSL